MENLIDLERYPLDDLAGDAARALIAACRSDLADRGSISLEGFLRPAALAACVGEVTPLMATASFHHRQTHNVYFTKEAPDLPAGHEALASLKTSNHTLTCDQLDGSVIRRVYEWDPLRAFLAEVLEKKALYHMADPLARLNVMGYGAGEGIGWHFDRARSTVTLLLQAPEAGGIFEYRRDLRAEGDPNYDGVARLLAGDDGEVRTLPLQPGTLNVFAGHDAAHRVTPIEGARQRLIAILSFMDQPGVMFTPEDRVQFYGRAG
jgi:hypothetical protein